MTKYNQTDWCHGGDLGVNLDKASLSQLPVRTVLPEPLVPGEVRADTGLGHPSTAGMSH